MAPRVLLVLALATSAASVDAAAAAPTPASRDVVASVHHVATLYRSEKVFVAQVAEFADRVDRILSTLRKSVTLQISKPSLKRQPQK